MITAKAASAINPLTVLDEITRLAGEWIHVHEEEETKRAQIAADAETRIAEIHARRDLFLTYLDKTFDEREALFERLFDRLDQALSHDPSSAGEILGSITALALKSPFADLRDPVAVRAKLADSDAEWEV
ncbi:MAG: hypothetical protein KAG80_12730 [Nocardioides sp.]|nr:hypothetical protein [Nocardioides sp.]